MFNRVLFSSEPLLDSIMHRIPSMENAEIRQMINGPESFTPDLHAVMGEAPEVSCIPHVKYMFHIHIFSLFLIFCTLLLP